MTLLEEIKQKCSPSLIASRQHGEIAAKISEGRTKPSRREIGNGTILDTIGLEYGNKMLDVINAKPEFRYVKPLLEQGRLIVGSPLVVQTIKSMVPLVYPQAVADLLLALTVDPDPVTEFDVRQACWSDNGEWLA